MRPQGGFPWDGVVSCSCPAGVWGAVGGKRGVEGQGSSHHCLLYCLYCWGGWSYYAEESPGEGKRDMVIKACMCLHKSQLLERRMEVGVKLLIQSIDIGHKPHSHTDPIQI